mmetsp:Transcript_20628/g.38489  ORF Transcript_20628/g.38489 Transcript_20628/m.38489 type:complete len:203 (+) Transcript_20628:5297-5905(+)
MALVTAFSYCISLKVMVSRYSQRCMASSSRTTRGAVPAEISSARELFKNPMRFFLEAFCTSFISTSFTLLRLSYAASSSSSWAWSILFLPASMPCLNMFVSSRSLVSIMAVSITSSISPRAASTFTLSLDDRSFSSILRLASSNASSFSLVGSASSSSSLKSASVRSHFCSSSLKTDAKGRFWARSFTCLDRQASRADRWSL